MPALQVNVSLKSSRSLKESLRVVAICYGTHFKSLGMVFHSFGECSFDRLVISGKFQVRFRQRRSDRSLPILKVFWARAKTWPSQTGWWQSLNMKTSCQWWVFQMWWVKLHWDAKPNPTMSNIIALIYVSCNSKRWQQCWVSFLWSVYNIRFRPRKTTSDTTKNSITLL